jgi:tetratricopeptide (TPR) repeat protein
MLRSRAVTVLAAVLIAATLVGALAWLVARRPGGRSNEKAETLYRAGDWRSAERLARAALKTDPGDTDSLRLSARSAARLGRTEVAENLYRRLGSSRLEAEDLFLLGAGLLHRGQTDLGLKSLRAALEVEPENAEALDAVSAHWANGRLPSAAIEAADRLRKKPGWEVIGLVRLARLRAELYDPASAVRLLSDAMRIDPKLTRADLDPAAARRLLVRSLLAAGHPAEARSILTTWLGAGPDGEASWLLSRALLQLGNVAPAAQALEASASFDSSDPMTAEPSAYMGAASCQPCHAKEYRAQLASPHARTLTKTAALDGIPWPNTLPDDNNPAASHTVRKTGDHFEITTQVGNLAFSAVIQYAMGSNHQGQTFLGRDSKGGMRELRVSRYPADPKWARTMDHPEMLPEPADYLGRPLSVDAVRKCLNCHSTDFEAVGHPAGHPEALDHAIGCERCHGPGGNHIAAVNLHFPQLAIRRPRLATAAQVVALCGECHRAPDRSSLDEPRAVRFQEPAVLASRCYSESDGGLSCVTCHNPHQPAERNAKYYEAICLECHAGPGQQSAPATGAIRTAKWSTCPVNARGDCLSCHMPRTSDAVPRAVFTDHFIRVRRSQ